MKIIFDSGIRTGANIFKALALGAHAAQVGRLYIWSMAHEGEAGCRHVMKSLLAVRLRVPSAHTDCLLIFCQDLDVLMTVAGYQSIKKDVNRGALRRSEHAHLEAKL